MELTTVIVDLHGFPTKPTRNSNGKLVALSSLHPRIPVTDVPYFQMEQIYTNNTSYGVGTLYRASKGLVKELLELNKVSNVEVDTFKQLNPNYNVYIGVRLVSYNAYVLNVLFGWENKDEELVLFTELDAHAKLYTKNGDTLTEKHKEKLSVINDNLHKFDKKFNFLNEPYLIELPLNKETVHLLKYRTSEGVEGIEEGRRVTYTPIYIDNTIEELLVINGDDYVYLKSGVVREVSLEDLITNLSFILSPLYFQLKSEYKIDRLTLVFNEEEQLLMKYYNEEVQTHVEISDVDKEYLLKVLINHLYREQNKED